MAKVYVSGSIRDVPLCRSVISTARDAGHEITHDWTTYDGDKLNEKEARRQLRGVLAADLFVLVVHPRLKAGWMEFGAAVTAHKHCLVLEHDFVSPSMWFTLPLVARVGRISELEAAIRRFRA